GKAAARLATGKWFNAGQTCIAPDYVLIDTVRQREFVQALEFAVTGFHIRMRQATGAGGGMADRFPIQFQQPHRLPGDLDLGGLAEQLAVHIPSRTGFFRQGLNEMKPG
ncbi:hypothetical protein, partial [Stenotrophomonas sp. 3diitr2024]|uniref:hypothetical protein n=1 Tax=Stenotrophomonas sp. 3diitr2024 TaxID=3345115 RepID=UPI0035CA3CD5